MRAGLLAGMVASITMCVVSSLAGVPMLAFSAAFAGLALAGVAAEQSQPKHWRRADNEYED